MPLVQAKCTNCGANLEIDNTKDAAICPYCGTAFIVEKAINNYNTTNQIHAGTVNIYGGNSADFVICGGVLEKYNGAAMEVVVPNSVKIIGKEAFADCIGITSVVLPDSVQEIGVSSFRRCHALTSVVIPNSVQKIGAQAFSGCSSLASVVIPDSVQKIAEAAFAECSSLASVTIPNSIQKIDEHAFFRCSSLASITIPNSVQYIGGSAFVYCTALRKVKIDGVPEIHQYDGFFRYNYEPPFLGCHIQIVEASEEWKKKNWSYFECLEEYRPKEQESDNCAASTITKQTQPAMKNQKSSGYVSAKNDIRTSEYFPPRKRKKRKSGCYVATVVYGSYDCPEVWTLRRFRDDTLDRTWYGRAFIRAYYAVSPTLVRWFGTTDWFSNLFKAPLDRLVWKLRQRGVEDTPYQDKY